MYEFWVLFFTLGWIPMLIIGNIIVEVTEIICKYKYKK